MGVSIMTNNRQPQARDAGAWAKQLLARNGTRRRRTDLVKKGRQTRARIQLLLACKLALITAALIVE
jgi:hypothetical protein